MDVQDGFILGIYNYCDRWCERCRFTSRCRVFADIAMHDAKDSPELLAVKEAPVHPSDVREPPPWLCELLEELSNAPPIDIPEPPPLPAHYTAVIQYANAYCDRTWKWLEAHDRDVAPDAGLNLETIGRLSSLIASKTRRALSGLAEFDGCRDFPPDHEGSAKVALDGIDRSITAWTAALGPGRTYPHDLNAFVEELSLLRCEIETLIPAARAFIRPGFDEPDEVQKLDATDWA